MKIEFNYTISKWGDLYWEELQSNPPIDGSYKVNPRTWRIAIGAYTIPPLMNYALFEQKFWQRVNEKSALSISAGGNESISPDRFLSIISTIREFSLKYSSNKDMFVNIQINLIKEEYCGEEFLLVTNKELLDSLFGLEEFLFDSYCLRKTIVFSL